MAWGDTRRTEAKSFTVSIKGFLPSGMLDWPGRISTTVFTAGCNFRCPFCHNSELVTNFEAYDDIDPLQLVSYLASRKLWVENVVITGGEPLTQKGITSFIRLLKENGLNVKLDTNGTRPKTLKELIDEDLIDFIAMDIKGPFENYPEIVKVPVDIDSIKESVVLIVNSKKEHEFRMTVVPQLLTTEMVVKAASEINELGAKKIILQQYQNQGTIDPSFEKIRPYPSQMLYDMAERIGKFMEVEVRGV